VLNKGSLQQKIISWYNKAATINSYVAKNKENPANIGYYTSQKK